MMSLFQKQSNSKSILIPPPDPKEKARRVKHRLEQRKSDALSEEELVYLSEMLSDPAKLFEAVVPHDKIERQKNTCWTVKLVVTALEVSHLDKSYPLLSKSKDSFDCGIVHVGLELPLPAHEVTDYHLLMIDLDYTKGNDALLVGKKLCEEVVFWNIYKHFNALYSNCQDFVDHMLKAIGVGEAQFGSLLSAFFGLISTMSNPEELEMMYPVQVVPKDAIKFHTHLQLDDYLNRQKSEQSREEAFLFKIYDKLFTLRHKTFLKRLDNVEQLLKTLEGKNDKYSLQKKSDLLEQKLILKDQCEVNKPGNSCPLLSSLQPL